MLKKYPTTRYVLLRAIWYFLTFLVALALNFFLPRLGSDPVDIMMAQSSFSSPEIRKQTEENLRKDFGLLQISDNGEIVRDDNGKALAASKASQLVNYISQVFHGDLGTSFKNQKPVSQIIIQALPWTIALQLPAIIFGWILGNGLGALAAYRRGVFDKVIFPLALLMSSIPFFVFGMVLVYFFGIVWEIFPAVGAYDINLTPSFSIDFLVSAAYHYILPFFSIFLILAGGQAIGMRSMGIYELGTDYIKYAKWLGLKETRVLAYLFRNAMLPQLTGLALSIGQMVGGALITEMIFSYPGLGMAMLTAIQTNDYPVIQGVTLLITSSVLLANFTVDILIALLDPRVKQSLAMDAN
ncbi:peptide ABC transporter permease [Fibrobacterales bacterium]|nr:peptide ABC transporter permease [Fibrobacterales bacterium]